jgi:hypothetical protein
MSYDGDTGVCVDGMTGTNEGDFGCAKVTAIDTDCTSL